MVRFTPKSGHQFSVLRCPFCANSRHSALRQRMSLFDYPSVSCCRCKGTSRPSVIAARLRQPLGQRAYILSRYAPIFAATLSASSRSRASQRRSSKSLRVWGLPLRYSLTASSIKTTLKIELGSARLMPLRFAILVMYLLSASADDPDLSQGARLVAHPPCPQRHNQNLKTGPNCVARMLK
jgi:hypothetical protein